MDTSTRILVSNLPVDRLTKSQLLARISYFVEHGDRPHSVFAVNPEKTFLAAGNPALSRVLHSADVVIPDGVGIVLAARFLYGVQLHRITGIDLMKELCALAAERNYRVFVYGARETVNREACGALIRTHPNLNLVGRSNGYAPDQEMGSLLRRINEAEPHILFVALGSPKQELWYASYAGLLKTVRVCQGVGGSLDVTAGHIKRAPDLFRSAGLEWLYRLLSEPRRITRQRVLPLFAWKVLKQRLGAL